MKNLRQLFLFMTLCLCGCDDEGEPGTRSVPGSNCDLVPDSGLCDAAITKYYYDKAEGRCKEFTWGGCGGVVPFHTMEECRQCEQAIIIQ